MKDAYLETISLVERLHRHYLEVVKTELERFGVQDLNNVQALILYNIGDEDLTVGELTNRGYYLGSNVSYNVKRMVEHGYLLQKRSTHDRRSVRLRVSDKGAKLCEMMVDMFNRQAIALEASLAAPESLETANGDLHRLEAFWMNILAYGLRMPAMESDENSEAAAKVA